MVMNVDKMLRQFRRAELQAAELMAQRPRPNARMVRFGRRQTKRMIRLNLRNLGSYR
jgi:hypothetical protein